MDAERSQREGFSMKVGFVGVGFMGRHMARNILKGGHQGNRI